MQFWHWCFITNYNKKPKVAIVLYLYHTDLWPEFKKLLSRLDIKYTLYIGLCKDNDNSFIKKDCLTLKNKVKISYHDNYGADVAPFLNQLHSIKEDLFIKIHSKKSKINQFDYINWRTILVNDLIGNPSIVNNNINLFNNSPELGMITNIPLRLKNFHSHLHVNQTKNILKILNIPQSDITHKVFIGGNMFMSRTKIFKNIFTKNKIKKILQLLSQETGKVIEDKTGTYTHAMERIFCYIVPYLNYTFNSETTSEIIKIQNNIAPNKIFNLIKLYNNDCYSIEQMSIYGKIIYHTNADIKIQWLHLLCDPVLYTKLNTNVYIQYAELLLNQFNQNFYQEMYPDTSDYYNGDKAMLYNHYMKYGRYEGRFPNALSYNRSLIDNKQQLYRIWKNQKWKLSSNKLDCICLLITNTELVNKKYDKFIQSLIKSCSDTLYKNITFKIIINTKTDINKHDSIKQLGRMFKSVQIHNLNLKSTEDIYIKNINNENHIKLPKQGLKSGPNLCFFEAIKLCKMHNTTLMLETDCTLGKNWLTKIHNYVQSCGPFLVSGSIYDGLTYHDPGSIMSTHINGGTGLYCTGNKIFQSLISLLQEKIAYEVFTKNNIGLAYDYALKLMIDNNLKLNNKSYELWKFINKYYISNPLIINLSTDNDTMHPNINQKYDFAILHKK